jgi:glycosyltransferase involved in cell wall biosynthesis
MPRPDIDYLSCPRFSYLPAEDLPHSVPKSPVDSPNPKTRLFHLITSLRGGGTENFLYQLLKGSPARFDHRVFYVGQNGVIGERIRRLGVPVEKINPLSFYERLKQERPDLLHTCLHWAHQVGRITGRLAKVPFILSSHRSIDVWQKPWHRIGDRWTLPMCDAVVVNSEAARVVIEQRLSGAAKRPRLYRIENGIDLETFRATDRLEARRALGLPPEAVVGGTLMRLHPEKGAEKIPAFAQSVLSQYPDLHLAIGGNGPLEQSLKKQTREWGDRLRWLGWQEKSAQFLSALDFVWLLSREESFPQVLLEASGLGVPWIAPDVGGVRELLNAGACGILFSPNTIDEAAGAARTIINELQVWAAKGRGAAPRVQERYDLKNMIRSFYRIVESRGQQP